jgi:hypothetical protein
VCSEPSFGTPMEHRFGTRCFSPRPTWARGVSVRIAGHGAPLWCMRRLKRIFWGTTPLQKPPCRFTTDDFGSGVSASGAESRVRDRGETSVNCSGARTARSSDWLALNPTSWTVSLCARQGDEPWVHHGIWNDTSVHRILLDRSAPCGCAVDHGFTHGRRVLVRR